MPRRHSEDASVGEDSFLDTIANLVGIMIILVVVVGSKTKIDAEAYGRELAEKAPPAELDEPVREVRALQQSLLDTHDQLRAYDLENAYRKLERDNLLDQVTLAREAVEKHLQTLDKDKRASIEQEQKLKTLQSKLSEMTEKMGAAEESKRPKIVLEHLPTPMAKTVFHREMHIKLQNNRVSLIPWDRLVDTLKQQVPLAARRNASRSSLEDTLGPIGGWMMKYRMLSVPGGMELDRFELEQVSTDEAEPIEQACSTSGRLYMELASRNPAETVVTVWIYPESFDTFRKLKMYLFEQGFLSAARPMPDGLRIGASPSGNRSSAQ
ncbi:MAG: hypothetical protein IT422_07775 [Pirellulaceae bacterium]|nr:hypothetical protein [Pirellulaceae bacterium]